jgi:hypothetical protein
MNQPPPLFDTNAAATLDRVKSIFTQRGTEYSDTWRTCQFLAMKAVAAELGAVIPEDAFRAIACAAFCDMKYQRLSGGYKEDSVDDGIAYNAMLVQEIRNTKQGRLPTLDQVQSALRDPLYIQADSAAQKVNGHTNTSRRHGGDVEMICPACNIGMYAPLGSAPKCLCGGPMTCQATSLGPLTPVVTTP